LILYKSDTDGKVEIQDSLKAVGLESKKVGSSEHFGIGGGKFAILKMLIDDGDQSRQNR
jgi:hypothetical protein